MEDFNIFAKSPCEYFQDILEDLPSVQAKFAGIHQWSFKDRTLIVSVETAFDKDFLDRYAHKIVQRMKESPIFDYFDDFKACIETDKLLSVV